MKKISLEIIGLCIGILCLFSFSSTKYDVQNIVYTEENGVDLVGEKVDVKGIDKGSFHILNVSGEKVRLFADFSIADGYYYNSSSDGDALVSFEDSMLYQGLQDGTSSWKSDIENAGGRTNIYLVDAPTLKELIKAGKLRQIQNLNSYSITEETPNWILYTDNYLLIDEKGNYDVGFVYNRGVNVFGPAYVVSMTYGGSIRPVLETSIYNLSSEDADVQAYFDSIKPKDTEQNVSNDNTDKVQTVKVPATGLNAPLIFTFVGLGILIIAGIIIWATVNGRSKE